MLNGLVVEGLGIIDRVEMELSPGFTALTGETGAGKSLLIESLKLLSGARGSTEMIRSGEKKLRVEGEFSIDEGIRKMLSELGIEAEDEIVIRREILVSGRSRCRVNDISVTTRTLQKLSASLLAIHGQHEQFGLADTAIQRGIIDQFGFLGDAVESTGDAFSRWREAEEERLRLEDARSRRRDRLDAIAYQKAEIDACQPVENEEEELLKKKNRLEHAGRLSELLSNSLELLADREDPVIGALARAGRAVEEMQELGLDSSEISRELETSRISAEEAVFGLRRLAEGIREDPGELQRVQERLHLLKQLMLKYGSTLGEVVEHRRRLALEEAELLSVEDRLEDARRRSSVCLEAYDAAARGLHAAREKAGRELIGVLGGILEKLGMKGALLEFRWSVREDPGSPLSRDGVPAAFDASGVEEVELFLAANPGEELKPMRKIASGGELSRIHLALRTALRSRSSSGSMTLLFDEVDSGLGGRVASFLAELLGELAGRDQVLVVTHLAQVAARADIQYRVSKSSDGHRTLTRVDLLRQEDRVEEIARMLAGDRVTDSARTHARELLRC